MTRRQANIWVWVMSLLILAVALIHISPFYILLTNSFKTREELYTNVLALPSSYSFQYYQSAIERMNFSTAFINSLIITSVSTTLIVLLTSMTAWVLARHDQYLLSKIIFMVFVATMLIPFQTLMMPLMQFFSNLQDLIGIPIIDTRQGLIFMYLGFGAPMSVFLYHGFIKSIPYSLEEAAYIDGASAWIVFWKIIFPMLRPITNTVVILNVIWIWNDFLLPSLVLASDRVKTIPLSTFSFFGQFTIQWNLAMAGLVLTILPVIVFYAVAQRNIVRGIAEGAVK